MDLLSKTVMEAFLDAATHSQSEASCEEAAVEAWLALRPGAASPEARREVRDILIRLRLIGSVTGAVEASPPAEIEQIVRAFHLARAAGLHPDNCLAQAVETWLRLHPGEDRITGERRVTAILERTTPSPAA